MKRNSLFFAIALIAFAPFLLMAQVKDTLFTTMLRGEPINFRYKVVTNNLSKESLSTLSKLQTPYYVLTEKDFNFFKINAMNSHHSLNTADSIIGNLRMNSKIDTLIQFQLKGIIEQTNQRVEVYRKSYEEAILLADSYSSQLGTCIELHKIKPKKRNWEAVVWGGVGGILIGLLTGVAISK
ncbi:MAG: hypothetical protein FGM41_07335 [Bacteroidetes bacterium]|nr:hypothetical protein [Bacteroidota bacterium]